MSEPCDLTAVEARRLIGRKALSPVELMASCLARIERVNPALNAVVTLDADAALDAARAAERAVTAGAELGPLHGLPVAVKDNRAVQGMRFTHGSLLHKDDVAPADDPSVALVRRAGGIPFCKTNLPEFGAGANTTNRVFGPTGNPFDPARTCGGSSGGSAVALATGMAPLATGSDYGGSLRTPASFCGVTGFRPSLGVAPLTSGTALSPWGVNGPMGRDVDDTHLLLSVQADHDPRDPFSHAGVTGIAAPLRDIDLGALRVAISPDLGCVPMDADIARTFRERAGGFGRVFGAVEQDAPDFGAIHDVFEVLRGLTFVAAHGERVKHHRELLDRNVVDNVERGLEYALADVAWAQAEQTRIYRNYLAFFEKYDALICPAASVSPFPHEQLFVTHINGEAMPTYMRWLAICYAPTMAFGIAAALPCGTDRRGLPFGIQVAGPLGADRKVLEIARALETVLAADPATARPIPDLAKLEARA
ncbi:MAG TPA: amidase family protein [Thermohalobaculum sp.]|nr:amidase family protein [Thermohalobaculum sp.]